MIPPGKSPGGTPLTADGHLPRKGVSGMVTYENLYAYSMVIIAVITLVLAFKSKDRDK